MPFSDLLGVLVDGQTYDPGSGHQLTWNLANRVLELTGNPTGGTPVPAINNFPAVVAIGQQITITLQNFTVPASTVQINGLAQTIDSTSGTASVTITIQAGTTTGTVYVESPNENAFSSGNITITNTPVVTNATPEPAQVGQTVTISGFNFTGTTSGTFDGVAIPSFTVVDNNTITFTASINLVSNGAYQFTNASGQGPTSANFNIQFTAAIIDNTVLDNTDDWADFTISEGGHRITPAISVQKPFLLDAQEQNSGRFYVELEILGIGTSSVGFVIASRTGASAWRKPTFYSAGSQVSYFDIATNFTPDAVRWIASNGGTLNQVNLATDLAVGDIFGFDIDITGQTITAHQIDTTTGNPTLLNSATFTQLGIQSSTEHSSYLIGGAIREGGWQFRFNTGNAPFANNAIPGSATPGWPRKVIVPPAITNNVRRLRFEIVKSFNGSSFAGLGEVFAWSTIGGTNNLCAASNGATATASPTTHTGSPNLAIDGVTTANTTSWVFSKTSFPLPQSITVTLASNQSIAEIGFTGYNNQGSTETRNPSHIRVYQSPNASGEDFTLVREDFVLLSSYVATTPIRRVTG